MSLANITVTLANTNVSVSESTSNVTVSSTTSNVVVGNTAVVTNSQIRAALSNTSPITYNATTGVIGLEQTLDDLTLKKYQETVVSAGNKSGATSFNITNGTIQEATLTGNITGITLSSISTGGSATLVLTQDSIGGHILDTTTTPSNWSDWEFVDDYTTLSGTATTGKDIMTVTYNGSKYFASVVNFQSITPSTLTASGNIETTGGFFLGDGGLLSNISGDISSVTAGTGLTGGGSSGAITLNVGAGTGITVNADDVAVNMSAFSTSDLSEGTNLYYTTARANTAITDFDGVLTPSSLTATGNVEGVTLKGTGALGLVVNGNATIGGNLDVTGNINSETVVDLFVEDRNITMQYGATGTPSANSQIFIDRGSSSNTYIKWDESTDFWKFSNDGSTEYKIAASTSDLAEGTNLYYTNARVDTHLNTDAPRLYQSNSSGNPIVIRHTASDITLDAKNSLNLGADDANVVITTGNGSETMLKAKGVGNKLFLGPGQEDATLTSIEMTTNAIDVIGNLNVANTSVFGTLSSNANITTTGNVSGAYLLGNGSAISNLPTAPVTSVNGATGVVVLDTADIAEDTNLYFTSARARGNISVGTPASASSGGALAYNSGTGVFTFTPADTQTDAEVRGLVSVGTPATPSGNGALAYDNSTGVFTFTPAATQTDAEVRALVSTTTAGASGGGSLAYDNSSGVFTFAPADDTAGVIAITDDTSTDASHFITLSPAASGDNALEVSSTKLSFNPSSGVLQTDHISSDSGQPLQLKGQTNGIKVDKTISSADARIVDFDTTGYGLQSADFHTGAIVSDNVPAFLIQASAASGQNTMTVTNLIGNAGLWAGKQTAASTYTSAFVLAAPFGGQSDFADALAAQVADFQPRGWLFFDSATSSTTGVLPSTAHVTGMSGNVITFSENFTSAVSLSGSGFSGILFPGAFSSTQEIGMAISGDTDNTSIPFSSTTPRLNTYTLPETLSNVTLDRVSYGATTVDLANVVLRHTADATVGTTSAIKTDRAILIGANATPDLLSVGTADILPATSTLGITIEQDGLTDFGGVSDKPQMKLMMNNYKTNSLGSETTYPAWSEFLGETGNATLDMPYLGAPNFNFKILGGTKTNKGATAAGDIPGRITWNTLTGSTTSGADQFNPPASIVTRINDATAGNVTTMANVDMYFQSSYPTSFRNGTTNATGSIPRTFLGSDAGNTVIAAKTDGKITLRPVRDYGDAGTDTSYVDNRRAHELHEYHEFLGAGFLGTKAGTLVEIQPKSGETGGSANFNYDSKGDATLRISSHYANNTVKAQWDITNDESESTLIVRDHTNSATKLEFSALRTEFSTSAKLKNYTTTEINALSSPEAGDVVYNTTLAKICFYNGSAWQQVTSAAM